MASPRDHAYLLEGYQSLLPLPTDCESHLDSVLSDVLEHPGGLIRAQVAFGILRGHGTPRRRARVLAIALEYLHAASLIFDDMPCMDDATERRGRPCPHLVHGEAAATLAALALVNQGYALCWQIVGELPPRRRRSASRVIAECLGAGGILNGQSHDLHFAGATREEDITRVADGKTVSLIRLTLLLPALVAGAGRGVLERLDRLSVLWGRGYQMIDDFGDCLLTRDEAGKTTARDLALGRPNLPRFLGRHEALARLRATLAEARTLTEELVAKDVRWRPLRPLQAVLEEEQLHVAARVRVGACA